MTKERIKELIALGLLPFLYVFVTDNLPERPVRVECDVYHSNAPVGKRCTIDSD